MRRVLTRVDSDVLDRLDLAATVVTADALHTQREHADWLVTSKQAAYALVLEGNQPALRRQLAALPWREVPVADTARGHGRPRSALCRSPPSRAWTSPTPPRRCMRITRRVRPLAGRRWRAVTVYTVTSLTNAQACPARLADWIRGHWGSRRCTISATPPSPIMPSRRLCRVGVVGGCWWWFSWLHGRHNHSPSRKASRGSGGR
jgi:hypothetical protein